MNQRQDQVWDPNQNKWFIIIIQTKNNKKIGMRVRGRKTLRTWRPIGSGRGKREESIGSGRGKREASGFLGVCWDCF